MKLARLSLNSKLEIIDIMNIQVDENDVKSIV